MKESNLYPLVSFIIPYYNHKKYIKVALDSILEDTYPNKEIVMINDGSSDHDDTVILDWIEEHKHDIDIRYLKRENKGLAKTFNELVDLARGEYIASIASDDYFINNTTANRVELLRKNPKKLMLVSDATVVDSENNVIYQSALTELRGARKKNYLTDSGLKTEIIKRWSMVGPTKFMDRRLFEQIGKYDETLVVEDWDFYLRACAKDLILFYDTKVAAYRWHGENMSLNTQNELRRAQDLQKTAKKHLSSFSFPYKYYLWRRYRSWSKEVKRLENLFN